MKQAQLMNNSHVNIQGTELSFNQGNSSTSTSSGMAVDNVVPASSGVRIKTEPPDVRIKKEPVDKTVPMETGQSSRLVGNSHSHNGPVHGQTSSGVSTDSDLHTAVRTFLKEKFQTHCVLSISELRKMLLFRLSESHSDDALNAGVSDRVMEECAIQIGAIALPIPVS